MSAEQAKLKDWARDVRSRLGLSQAQLARVLGVSVRAIQSYEQGWRAVPRPIATQMMTVLALHRSYPDHSEACWNLTGCEEEKRARCASSQVGRGRFCWLLAGNACGGKTEGRATGPHPCIDCVVTRTLLDGPRRRTPPKDGPSTD